MQDAVGALLQSTHIDTPQSQKLHPGLPPTWVRASALLNPWSRSQSPAAVHPLPTCRPTDSSSDLSGEDEDEQNPAEDLVAAAVYLLQDSTLGGDNSVPKAEQQKQKQPGWDWGEFVQKQLQTQASVAASSKLLAMRNAVPSHSARLVFASQVRKQEPGFSARSLHIMHWHELHDCGLIKQPCSHYSMLAYNLCCWVPLKIAAGHSTSPAGHQLHLNLACCTTANWALKSEHKSASCVCPAALCGGIVYAVGTFTLWLSANPHPCCALLQVLTSADIRNALETAEAEEYQEPAESQHGPFPEAEEPAAEAQAVVQQWLDASSVLQSDNVLPEADKARAEGQMLPDVPSPLAELDSLETRIHVAALVQQYEQLGSDQAATQQTVADLASAVWPVAQQSDRPVSGRPRLAPLQIPEGLVLHSTGPEEATADVTTPDGTTPDGTTPGAPLLTSAKLQPAPSLATIPGSNAITSTPRSHHQPLLQGAVARNQAAVAAHRARLHLNEHSLAASAGSPQHEGAAVRHGWAVPVKKNATPATPRALATQRSSLDTGRPASPLSRLSSFTSSSEVRRTLDASLGSPSPRPPLRRFGSVATPSSLAAGSLSPPGSAPLRRGVSVATPRKAGGTLHRQSLDTGGPLPPVQGQRLSPPLVRGTSVTIAEIMKQNSRLPPLDHVLPPSPVLKPLPTLRFDSSSQFLHHILWKILAAVVIRMA